MFSFQLPKFLTFWKSTQKPVQKKHIESSREIAHLLQKMQEHIVIITASFNADMAVYNTSIIKVDTNKKQFHLDEFLPANGNQQLKRLKSVALKTRLHGAILTMNCQLHQAAEENGVPCFIMDFPQSIHSIQRRESYRVSIPVTQHYQATLQTDAGHFIAGFLHDISFSGVSIRLEDKPDIDFEVGNNIPFLTLHLDDTITCSLEVRRISHTINHLIVSGKLEDVSPQQQKVIQQFITRLDREKRQDEKS